MVREKGGRLGRNPKTGIEVPISARRVVVFRPSAIMKQRINRQPPGRCAGEGVETRPSLAGG
jgi:integration host factor subunit alpha